MTFGAAESLLQWVAIGVLALAVSGLLRQLHSLVAAHAPRALAPVGLEVGTLAPRLPALVGMGVEPILILFMDTGCATCDRVKPDISRLTELGDIGTVFALYAGDSDGELGNNLRVVDQQTEAFALYRVPLTPYGVGVDANGIVLVSGPIGSREALRDMARKMLEGGRVDVAHR